MIVFLSAFGCAQEDPPENEEPLVPEVRETSRGSVWHQSFARALKESQEQDKPVLLDFAGDDWCEPCRILRKNVFETEQFAEWAESRVVLLEVQVPDPSQPRSADVVELTERYSVTTFPTVLILNSDGDVLGSIEGAFEDSTEWIEVADGILTSHDDP